MADVARRGVGDEHHVEDVVHNAFVVAYGKEKSNWPEPEDEGGCLAWLCRIVRLLVLSHRRKYREEPMAPEDLEQLMVPEVEPRSYDDILSAQSAIDTLSPEQRDLLEQHFLHEKPLSQIAQERGVAYTTVVSQFHGALSDARAFVENDKPPSRRRRTRVAAFPLVLFAMFAREARAAVSVARARVAASLTRSPMRFLGGVAAAAAFLGATPSDAPCAMPHDPDGAYAQTVAAGAVHEDPIAPSVERCERVERTESLTLPPIPTQKPAAAPRPPPRARPYVERSLGQVVDANAVRHGDLKPQ
ncbi:sigma-70 family RNA polymerase sigma factor [Polyangium sp. 6x1]|uniref:sigma-70 family RNA polymerase sigma factor n=1 Tax=Polyangium sp. 6x1 TaxID=3042689 RepID=UPI00248313FA|nr:sigma-70 family RNA polymerase sigma factor [Polyangium sp. 6x1]